MRPFSIDGRFLGHAEVIVSNFHFAEWRYIMGARELLEVSQDVGSRPVIRRWYSSLAVLLVIFSLRSAFGCSCSNNTPIQPASDRYRDGAVFTAHIAVDDSNSHVEWQATLLASSRDG